MEVKSQPAAALSCKRPHRKTVKLEQATHRRSFFQRQDGTEYEKFKQESIEARFLGIERSFFALNGAGHCKLLLAGAG